MTYPDEIILKITEDDITRGIKERCEECPAALAAMKIFPGRKVSAGMIGIIIYSRKDSTKVDAIYWALPSLMDFMDDFDAGNPVSPVEFQLWKT